VLTDQTVIIGNRCVIPSAAAGAVTQEHATDVLVTVTQVSVGWVEKVTANTGWSTINLRLDS
jgi:hypothetical protein